MAKRTYSDIVNDIKTIIADNGLDADELRNKVSGQASELENKLKKDKTADNYLGIFILAILSAFAVYVLISIMDNNDLRETIIEKTEIIESYEKITKSDTITSYKDKNGQELTVSGLLKENLELMRKISDYEHELFLYKEYLNLIETVYGIKVIDKNNIISLKAEKVDSALKVFSVHKDKLKYDSVKNQWVISGNTYIHKMVRDTIKISEPK